MLAQGHNGRPVACEPCICYFYEQSRALVDSKPAPLCITQRIAKRDGWLYIRLDRASMLGKHHAVGSAVDVEC